MITAASDRGCCFFMQIQVPMETKDNLFGSQEQFFDGDKKKRDIYLIKRMNDIRLNIE